MFKHPVVTFVLLTSVFTPVGAYSEETVEDLQIITVSGAITRIDSVGNVLNVQTNEKEMAFYLTGQTSIVKNARDIGLFDLKVNDHVTIQYEVSSPGKNRIISLVDNESQ